MYHWPALYVDSQVLAESGPFRAKEIGRSRNLQPGRYVQNINRSQSKNNGRLLTRRENVHKALQRLLCLIMSGLLGVVLTQSNGYAEGPPLADKQREIEAKLELVLKQLAYTDAQVRALSTEVQQLRSQLQHAQAVNAVSPVASAAAPAATVKTASVPTVTTSASSKPRTVDAAFQEVILDPGLNEDERKNELRIKPELFVQGRYSTLPSNGATVANFPSNFRVSRVEMHWSGRISDRLGAGFEIQYHPANDGDPTQLINDAFLQYYPNGHVAVTAGQFLIPFGFENSQSSSIRESPERAMFVGYFFPGHRDRGAMVQGDLGSLHVPALEHVHVFAGIFNGNRFWADNNRQLNYNFRVRKLFNSAHLAIGFSGQVGHQLFPPGVHGPDNQNVVGFDMQYTIGRLGFRTEFVAGDMPSTLLSIRPTFAPAFRPGRHSASGTAQAIYRLTSQNYGYVRYDQFNSDPVTNLNVRAFNSGYFRLLGESSRIGVDYQWKNHLSFNDDAVNSRLQVSWSAVF